MFYFSHMYFKEIKWKNRFIIFLTYNFQCSPFLSEELNFSLALIPFRWENLLLAFLVTQVCWWQLVLSEKVFSLHSELQLHLSYNGHSIMVAPTGLYTHTHTHTFFFFFFKKERRKKCSPGQVAQLGGALFWYAKVTDLIPIQDAYKKQPINAHISGTINWYSSAPSLPCPLFFLKSVKEFFF